MSRCKTLLCSSVPRLLHAMLVQWCHVTADMRNLQTPICTPGARERAVWAYCSPLIQQASKLQSLAFLAPRNSMFFVHLSRRSNCFLSVMILLQFLEELSVYPTLRDRHDL